MPCPPNTARIYFYFEENILAVFYTKCTGMFEHTLDFSFFVRYVQPEVFKFQLKIVSVSF